MAFSFTYIGRKRYAESPGVNDSWIVKAEGIGKDNECHPYLIANEWIAGRIAQFLGLPVPPFALMSKRRRDTMMFVSFRFDIEASPPDVVASQVWERHPHLCTGILLFDILIANCDRHGGNLKVDSPTRPTRVHVFDHDRSLFYVYPREGIRRLKSISGHLGISGGRVSGGSRHCLMDSITTTEHFNYWLDFIERIPDLFIDRTCHETRKLGATKREADAVSAFLKDRRSTLGELVYSHRSAFPAVVDWRLFP